MKIQNVYEDRRLLSVQVIEQARDETEPDYVRVEIIPGRDIHEGDKEIALLNLMAETYIGGSA